jgi:WD40 repeat protein
VLDLSTGNPVVNYCCLGDSVWDLAFNPDGALLGVAAASADVWLWDIANGQHRRILTNNRFSARNVRFSPDGRWIASTTGDGTLWLWSAPDFAEPRRIDAHKDFVFSISFSRDSTALLTASQDKFAKLFDVQSGTERQALPHSAVVMDATFTHGETRLLTATLDGGVFTWDAQTGKPLSGPRAQHAAKVQLGVSKDGSRVATFSWDRTAKVWDTRTWKEVARFTHAELVDGGAISPDGKHLATFTPFDVRITPIDVADIVGLAESRVSRKLTRAECEQYVHQGCDEL